MANSRNLIKAPETVLAGGQAPCWAADEALNAGQGESWVRCFTRVKQSEYRRHA